VPVQILSPKLTNGNFSFSFVALSGQSYTIQNKADLTGTNWADYTNFLGSGSITQIALPVTASNQFFRVRQP